MKQMATRRPRRLHPCIIAAEHGKTWPVIAEAEARAINARIPAAFSARITPRETDPREVLTETYARVMAGGRK